MEKGEKTKRKGKEKEKRANGEEIFEEHAVVVFSKRAWVPDHLTLGKDNTLVASIVPHCAETYKKPGVFGRLLVKYILNWLRSLSWYVLERWRMDRTIRKGKGHFLIRFVVRARVSGVSMCWAAL